MCEEVIQIVKTMDRSELETQLALQCAPLLTSVKMSNLLIINKDNRDAVIQTFQKTLISYYVILESKNKIIFLLYHKKGLIEYLGKNDVRNTLFQFGYDRFELFDILKEFSRRYCNYNKQEGEFPHELGLLLGYPLEDVKGFIKNQGKNYLYTGYWKVYSNPVETIQLFDKYNRAKEMVIRMLAEGMRVHNILEVYYSNKYKNVAN